MHYSVQPRHLHYTDVMLLLCCVMFDLALGLGLGFEHLSLGLGLGLDLLSLESKPASKWHYVCFRSEICLPWFTAISKSTKSPALMVLEICQTFQGHVN